MSENELFLKKKIVANNMDDFEINSVDDEKTNYSQNHISLKSPNFIRTKARHFDNLMSWLVRLGSIK